MYKSFCVVLLLSLASGPLFAGGTFHQKGYLKDRAKNRIFTVEMRSSVKPSKALAYARREPNSAGRFTAVYFFPRGGLIPTDGVTGAKTVLRANYVLYDMKGLSQWRFAYMKSLTGDETFVDCLDTPDSYLCRQ